MVTPAPDREAFEQAIVRGSELLKQNLLDQAQRAFRAALELEPDSARVLALLGLAHFRAGEFADARPIYEDLVERAPTDASHRLNLGLVYLKLNDAEHAISSLEASRALDPSQGRAVSYLGLAYARAGRYAEAYRSFLLANQNELATEIAENLTPSERDGIHAQLQRSPSGPLARTLTPQRSGETSVAPRTFTPPAGNRAVSGETPVAARTTTPPAGNREVSGELATRPPSGEVAKPRTPTPPLPRTLTPPAVPTTPPTSQELLVDAWTTDDRPPSKDSMPAVARAITPAPARTITPHRGSRQSGEIPIIPAEVVVIDPPPEREQTEIPIVERAPVAVEIFPRSRPPTSPPPNRAKAIELVADEPPLPPAEPIRMTESMQFVLGLERAAAPAAPLPGASMISRAVAAAEPSAIAATPMRTPAGATLPRPLSELATDDLIQIDDGDHPFEISAGGALVVRVKESMFTRLDGVHVLGGDLTFKLAMRHSRGHQTEEKFDYGAQPLHVATGTGYLIATPTGRTLTSVVLDDDIFYLREDLVFAFEPTLRWENGNVPGLRGRLPVVQFRGDGAIAMSLARPLVRVKLPPQGLLLVDAARLAGWIGRVIPRAVVPPQGGPLGEVCIECTGEGVVLVEPRDATPSIPRLETARVPLAGTVQQPNQEPASLDLDKPEVKIDATIDPDSFDDL